MPKLNDYIGSLVASITNARVMSDLQTVKVAEEYAKHDLLKHFSIPRMRIDDIEMTIPVALDEFEDETETVFEPIDNTKFNALVYQELLESLGVTKLPASVSRKLRSEIARQTQVLEHNLQVAKNFNPLKMFSQEITTKSVELGKKLSGVKRKTPVEVLPKHLEKRFTTEIKISSQKKAIDNLNVIVEAHKLREQKPENIIHIKLKITEDGMEWDRTEKSNGEIESKLLPE